MRWDGLIHQDYQKKGVKVIIKTISGIIAEGFSTKVKGKRGKIHPVVQEAYDLADGTLKVPCSSYAWVLKFLRMKGKKQSCMI